MSAESAEVEMTCIAVPVPMLGETGYRRAKTGAYLPYLGVIFLQCLNSRRLPVSASVIDSGADEWGSRC